MPARGLIPDSPLIYGAQKLGRSLGQRGPRGFGGPPVRMTISYRFSGFKPYRSVIHYEMYNRYGLVARYLHKIANRINMGAKAQVGVETGRLRKSIKITHFQAPFGAAVKIGSDVHYALLHHEGSKPHLITPKEKNGVLVFTKGAKMVVTKRVMHPGTKPNRYLSDQLRIHAPR